MTNLKHAPRSANPIDLHVGTRIRIRRQVINMSQEKLGDQLGVTFQQVQKYERGANRVSASRMWKMSQVLGVTVGFFFDGLETPGSASKIIEPDSETSLVYDFINSTDGVELAKAIVHVKKPQRRAILEMVRSMAKASDSA